MKADPKTIKKNSLIHILTSLKFKCPLYISVFGLCNGAVGGPDCNLLHLMKNKLEIIGKEKLCLNLLHYPKICLERLRNAMNKLGQDNQCPEEWCLLGCYAVWLL
jgi:hypothetical protein